MGKRILDELKQWTKGEIIFYSIIFALFTLTICIAGAILDFRIHFIIFSIFAMISFILATKRTFIGYILLLVCLVAYCIIAYINKYYSEVFIAVLFITPFIVIEIIRWVKQKTNQPTLPEGKILIIELAVTVVLGVLLYFGAYKLFYIIQNSWLIGSSFAVCFGALFLYSTTYQYKILSSFLLVVYVGLATTCWVLSAVCTDISYAAIALAMIAIFAMTIRMLIVEAAAFAKTIKQAKLENVSPDEKQPKKSKQAKKDKQSTK